MKGVVEMMEILMNQTGHNHGRILVEYHVELMTSQIIVILQANHSLVIIVLTYSP